MAAGEIERDGRSHQVAYQHYVDGVPWKELAAAAGYSSVAACRQAANLWLRELNDLHGLGMSEEKVVAAEQAAYKAAVPPPAQRRAQRERMEQELRRQFDVFDRIRLFGSTYGSVASVDEGDRRQRHDSNENGDKGDKGNKGKSARRDAQR